MRTDKLTNEEKAYIAATAEMYQRIGENMKNFSIELKTIQDKIVAETTLLEDVRAKEKDFMEKINETYGFTPETFEIIEVLNEIKK
jgi:uncharacterized protein YaaN involved in tellurite resistance